MQIYHAISDFANAEVEKHLRGEENDVSFYEYTNLYVYVFIYMYICVYVYRIIYICISAYICINVCIYAYTF
jgi:hypothetical protein